MPKVHVGTRPIWVDRAQCVGVDFLTTLGAVYGAIIAAALASFACVISDRGSRHEPFMGGRSRCACGRQLRAYENVPILGWVRVWGKARCCGARIPAKYVIVEAAAAGVGAGFGTQMAQWFLGGTPLWAVALCGLGGAVALVGIVAGLTWPHGGSQAALAPKPSKD